MGSGTPRNPTRGSLFHATHGICTAIYPIPRYTWNLYCDVRNYWGSNIVVTFGHKIILWFPDDKGLTNVCNKAVFLLNNFSGRSFFVFTIFISLKTVTYKLICHVQTMLDDTMSFSLKSCHVHTYYTKRSRISSKDETNILHPTYIGNIHTYMPTSLHTCIPTYLHTYIHACMHTYILRYIHVAILVYKIFRLPCRLHTGLQVENQTWLHNKGDSLHC